MSGVEVRTFEVDRPPLHVAQCFTCGWMSAPVDSERVAEHLVDLHLEWHDEVTP